MITQFSQAGISDVTDCRQYPALRSQHDHQLQYGKRHSLAATAANKAVIETSSRSTIPRHAAGIGNQRLCHAVRDFRQRQQRNANDSGAINVDSSSITGNGTGITVSIIRLSNSDVTLNTTGFSGAHILRQQPDAWKYLVGNRAHGAGGAVSNLGEQ